MRVLGGVGGADSVVDTAVGRLSRWFGMHLQRGEDESVEPLQVTIAFPRGQKLITQRRLFPPRQDLQATTPPPSWRHRYYYQY